MKHTGRLFCLFLALCMLTGLLPVSAQPMMAAVSGLDTPRLGELIDFTAVPALPAAYSVEEVCWYRASGTTPGQMFDTVCQTGERFVDSPYLCRVYLTFAQGIEPAAGAVGAIGGELALLGLYRGRWFLEYSCVPQAANRIADLFFGGIDYPAAGRPVGDYLGVTLTTPAECVVTGVRWALNGETLAESDTLRAGDRLSCMVTTAAIGDYRFGDHPTATLCGKASSAAIEELAGLVYSFVFLFTVGGTAGGTIENITVGSVSLAVPAPVAGQTAADHPVTASRGVHVLHTAWSPADAVFTAGQSYTLTVTLGSAEGYIFPENSQPLVTLGGDAMQVLVADTHTLLATYTFAPAEIYTFPFTDVPEHAWYYPWVRGAHQMGLINGKSETTFVPFAEMTWAEAVKLAACMHQLSHSGRVTLTNGDPWFAPYLDYCRAQGILPETTAEGLPGYAEISARLAEPITRAEYVWLFARALPDQALTAVNTVPDNSIPDVASDGSAVSAAIYRFYRAGILNGMDASGTFSPNSSIRRSDVAAILMRLMDTANRVGAPAALGH